MSSSEAHPDVPLGRLRRVMVTGANGFVGRHVIADLVGRGISVVAVGHADERPPETVATDYFACDLADLDQVQKLPLGEVGAVINLAGLAAVGQSFSQRDRYLAVNVGVLDTLCTVAMQRRLVELRILAISSGAVYAAGQPMPLSESARVDPTSSPYAESKLAMEERARTYRTAGLDCVVVRPFNHIGPGQSPGFLVPDLVAEIHRAQAQRVPLRVGNLSTRRDYTDVRDVAAAYVALAAADGLARETYNVCTGRSLSGTEILDAILEELGLSDMPVTVDPSKFRPSDQTEIVGDAGRVKGELGWKPAIPVRRSIRDFVMAGGSNRWVK
jgi:GDP-4-dehydro-6-deoxy-D-mannose reductase